MTGEVNAARTVPKRRMGLVTLVSAHASTSLGEAMTIVAVPWFVLQTTGSVARTGAVVAVAGMTAAIAGFLAGPLVDRVGFKRFTVVAYVVGSIAVGAIVLLHAVDLLSFGALLLLIFVATGADAPRRVATSGLVPHLARDAGVPLDRANSAFRAASNLSALLGPALGGVAAAIVGAENVLLFDAAAGLVAAALVAVGVRQPTPDEAATTEGTAPEPAGASSGGYLARLRHGVRFLKGAPLLRWVTATSAAHNLLDSAVAGVVLVSVAFYWFEDAASFGVMLSALGVGALAGTLVYGGIGHRVRRRPVYVLTSLGIAAPFLLVAAAPPFWLTLVAMALIGMLSAPRGPLLASALQETVPTAVYGRVVSAIQVLVAAVGPVGIGLVTVVVSLAGVQLAVAAIATSYLLVGLMCWRVKVFTRLDTSPAPLGSTPPSSGGSG